MPATGALEDIGGSAAGSSVCARIRDTRSLAASVPGRGPPALLLAAVAVGELGQTLSFLKLNGALGMYNLIIKSHLNSS